LALLALLKKIKNLKKFMALPYILLLKFLKKTMIKNAIYGVAVLFCTFCFVGKIKFFKKKKKERIYKKKHIKEYKILFD
jgi:hypothetical protein